MDNGKQRGRKLQKKNDREIDSLTDQPGRDLNQGEAPHA